MTRPPIFSLPALRGSLAFQGAIALLVGWSVALAPEYGPALADETDSFNDSGQSEGPFTGGVTRTSDLPDFSQTGESGSGRTSGVTRSSNNSGECSSPESLTPLVPTSVGGGYTTQARPTFWVYIPYSLTDDSPVFFSLMGENNDLVYETQLSVSNPGIYSVNLPSSVELQIETTYKWYVQIYCNDPAQLEVPQYIRAWSERVAIAAPLTPEQQSQMSPAEQSAYYSEQLIWYDALTVLASELQTSEEDIPNVEATIESAWDELLTLPSVELEDLTDQPFTPCCANLDDAEDTATDSENPQ